MAEGQSRGLMLSAMALAIFVGAMVWALMGPSDEAALPAAASQEEASAEHAPSVANSAPKAAEADEQAPAAKAPVNPPVDLFAGEMPDFMANAHGRVLDKKSLGVVDQKALYDYGKANPSDARPQLLLAWDSMNRDWDGIGVRMYKIAYKADPRVKEDPRMLEDLIDVAATHDKIEYRDTVGLVQEVYGSDAIGKVEEAIEEHSARGAAKNVERLTLLRSVLKGEAEVPAGPDRTKVQR